MVPKNSRASGKMDLNNRTVQMEQLYENETRCTENNLKDTDQQSVHAEMQMLQSPVFNIHIHVPPYKGDSLKMHLPRIQPVIHLHFDELAKRLEINKGQTQEAKYRAFQNLLSMSAPKFGGVQFHYQNKSNETVISESKLERKTPCTSENYSTDTDVNVDEILEPVESGNSDDGGITNHCESHNSSNNCLESNMNESSSDTEETSNQKLKRKFKLKEPVVVLQDICKTRYYKYMVAAGYISDLCQNVESECDNLTQRGECAGEEENIFFENEELLQPYIKKEVWSPESDSPKKSIEAVNCLNTSNHRSCTNSVGWENINSASSSEKTLIDLAEGCNFSDILSRFQLKPKEFPEDFAKCKDNGTEFGPCCTLTDKEECHCKLHNQIQEQHYCNSNQETLNTSGGSICRSKSHDTENKPYFQDFNESIEIKHLSVFCRSPSKCKFVSQDTAFQLQANETNDSEPSSVDNNLAAERHSASNKDPLDSRKEVFSPSKTSYVHENFELKLPQTKGNNFDNLGITHLPSDLISKAMKQKQFQNNFNGRTILKKTLTESDSSSPDASSLPKKMKHSDVESNKAHCKTKTSTVMEDYIPLQASGPTKFAVAPLDKVNPHKSHDARNFRKEMLFGNRVQRFSSSDHLRIYQLKQKAAKSQSD